VPEHPSPQANVLVIKDLNEWVADPKSDPATQEYLVKVAKLEKAAKGKPDADTN
jgi:hypothetical protein